MSHLLELRNRIMRGGGSILIVFLIAAPFANDLYEYLAAPLMDALPEGNSMISTEPHGPFFVTIEPRGHKRPQLVQQIGHSDRHC